MRILPLYCFVFFESSVFVASIFKWTDLIGKKIHISDFSFLKKLEEVHQLFSHDGMRLEFNTCCHLN